jgi:hypothetical protein
MELRASSAGAEPRLTLFGENPPQFRAVGLTIGRMDASRDWGAQGPAGGSLRAR